MLDPSHQRAILLEHLRPPHGYRLDFAVGTSYSLDLLALLTAPLAFTFFDWEDEDGRPSADPIALLEALRRHADRILLFCQAGAIKIPPPNRPLLAFLEPTVVEVEPPNPGGVFHPKVWVLRFVDPGGAHLYRMLCLSRNLTFDRSWDTLLVLEGNGTSRRNVIKASKPLGDFLDALPDMAIRPLAHQIREAVQDLAHEVRRVRFEVPEPFDPKSLRFHPLGLGGPGTSPIPANTRRLLVVSPFVDAGALSRLARDRRQAVLVSRTEELGRVDREVLDDFIEVLALDPLADPEETDEDAAPSSAGEQASHGEGEAAPPIEVPHGLHAKLFVQDDGWYARIWTGSANATTAAFERNVEFLVELHGLKSKVGIDALLGRADAAKPSGLRILLRNFEPSDDHKEDAARRELGRRLERACRSFARLPLRIVVESAAAEDGTADRIHLILRCDAAPPRELDGVTVRLWPASLPGTCAVTPAFVGPELARFGPLATGSISAFLAVEFEASSGLERVTLRTALVLPLDGAPPGRRQAVLLEILRDRNHVLKLLWMLLAREGVSVSEFVDAAKGKGGVGASRPNGMALPLLEAMMRALAEDPRRLDDVAKLVEDLMRTERGASLLPENFDAVWQPIRAVREELAR